MFKHRPPLKGLSYAPRRAFGWLVYLACQLSQRELAAFFVERLQMDWLQHADQRKYLCFTGLVGGLVVGLIGVLVVGLVGKPVLELVIGPTYAPAYVLLFGLIAGLAFGLQLVKYPRTISPVDQVNLRRPRWINLVITLAGGLITGLIVGWVAGLFIGLLVGLGIFLQLMVEEILVPVESERREQPNQGIHRTLQNLIRRYILINMLILGLGAGLVAGLSFGLAAGLLAGLAFGLTAALIGGLVSPASQTVTRHYFLRWKLHREGLLPLKLIPFLDAMTERLLLRRVGGGYIFIHRTLMEHFASLSEDELDVLAARIEA